MPRRSIALCLALFALSAILLATIVPPVSAHDDVAGTPDVTITLGNGLSDRAVSVPAGGIVRFLNSDDERHRLRSRTGRGFDTGDIEPGDAYQVRLSTVGTYTYIDERDDDNARFHGRIVVGGEESTDRREVPAGKTATVTIGDRVFRPATTTITAGGRVTFRNADSDEHSATGGIIDSGPLSPGARYEKTFPNAGTYDFLCIFHPEMQGTIQVLGEKVAEPTPPPAATPTPAPTAVANAVQIVDLAFEPASLRVEPGTTVTWTNTGVAPHTVTAEDDSFDSGTLESGATFEQTFAEPGTYPYLCQIHPQMTGTIDVVGTTAVEPAAVIEEVRPGPSADLGSLGGIVLSVTLVSIAGALFARVLRGTVRTPRA